MRILPGRWQAHHRSTGDSHASLQTTLKRFVYLYNHHISQKGLLHKTPFQTLQTLQTLQKWYAQKPQILKKIPRNHRDLMTMNRFYSPLTLLLLLSLVLEGCASTPKPVTGRNSQLTQGNVQLSIQVGKTTKSQVLEIFGSPNITTRDSNRKEVWTYQRSYQAAQSSSKTSYWSLLLAGQSGSNSGFEHSSRMITLIIKFDENDVVSDFNSQTLNF